MFGEIGTGKSLLILIIKIHFRQTFIGFRLNFDEKRVIK